MDKCIETSDHMKTDADYSVSYVSTKMSFHEAVSHWFTTACIKEGLNGINRQPSNGQKSNRQPSKMENSNRQPSINPGKISRQRS